MTLSQSDAVAVHDALTSLLLNVRLHTRAQLVVVHLDRTDARWILTVHDDGTGLDVDAVDLGVGLREVVIGELARRGMEATVGSRRGEGTTVTLSGPGTGTGTPAAHVGVS